MKEQIAEYVISLYRDIPVEVYEGLLSVLCLGVVVIIACYGLKRGWRRIAGVLLVEYMFLIYCSTVIYRQGYERAGYKLSPFWSYTAIPYGRTELLAENIMNVVVFVPIGFLLVAGIKGLKCWYALLIGFCLSSSIEILQFVFKKGVAETDDVMHNTVGCMIGYGIYKTGQFMFEHFSIKTKKSRRHDAR